MNENVRVIKKDGTIEPFNPGKIAKVLRAAGLEQEPSETVVSNISSWVESLHQNVISVTQIREKVIAELQKVNTYIANLFQWYEKTKDGGTS